MSIFGNLSDLAHEIRSGVGTVLTILGSKLEADARARVECGPQWLTEFEEQRDSLEPVCTTCGNPDCCIPTVPISAVVAADPSPTVPNAHSVVGGEGRGEDSDILQSASLRRSTDPGEVSAPSPGEPVREDDLAAHITAVLADRPGWFLSDPQIGEFVASDLLADFNITRK